MASSPNPAIGAPNTATYINNLENIFFGGARSLEGRNDFNFGRAVSAMNDCDKKSDEQKNQSNPPRVPVLRRAADNLSDNQSANAAVSCLGNLLRGPGSRGGGTSAIAQQDLQENNSVQPLHRQQYRKGGPTSSGNPLRRGRA